MLFQANRHADGYHPVAIAREQEWIDDLIRQLPNDGAVVSLDF